MDAVFCAIDFETYYHSKEGYGLKQQTMWEYTQDPRFDAFLVSVHGQNRNREIINWVGDPTLFDWSQLEGVTLVCHNASFDGLVLARLRETGKVKCSDHEFVDTADLAAFLRAPRNLKGAAHYLLGVELSKAVRDSMDGKRFRGLPESVRAEWIKYAADDARYTYQLWDKFGKDWPIPERLISKYNREAGWHGVAVDRKALGAGIQTLHTVLRTSEESMPWIADGQKAGSAPALRRYARAAGMDDVPVSLRRDDPVMVAWVEKHKDDHDFIQARLDHASATPHYARLISMKRLLDDEGVIRFDTLYHGTNTARITASSSRKSGTESTSSRFNPLNIPKAPVFGVDIRGMLIPRKGHKFLIYDYAQVEARLVQWESGNEQFLELIKEENIYQATAKLLGWFPVDGKDLKKVDNECYQLAKRCALGCGFAMGHKKFRETCAKYGVTISEEKSKETVTTWREKNPSVVNLWRYHHQNLTVSAMRRDNAHTIALPSGRKLSYFAPEQRAGTMVFKNEETGKMETRDTVELYASVWMESDKVKLYGGKLVENITQSVARDIMYAGQVKISREHPNWIFLWNAYDEVIFEVPDSDVEEAKREIPYWLCNAAEWAKGCPLEVEGGVFDRYMK